MGIIQTIEQSVQPALNKAALGEFFKLARCLALHKGDLLAASAYAKNHRATDRVVNLLHKAAVAPGSTSTWSDLVDYTLLSEAFSQSLRNVGVFDRALPFMIPSPLRSRAIKINTLIVGFTPAEGAPKPITKLDLSSASDLVSPKKASAIVVATAELLKLGNPSADQLFNRELTGAVAQATDKTFLDGLIAVNPPLTSGADTIATLLNAISTNDQSEIFFISTPALIKKLATATSTNGRLYPDLGPAGGELMPGVIALPSDQLAAGVAVMFDATGIAAGADVVSLDSSENAVLDLSDVPTNPITSATVVQSLWASDQRALRAERFFGFSVVRTSSVVSMTGITAIT